MTKSFAPLRARHRCAGRQRWPDMLQPLAAQTADRAGMTGEQLYRTACVSCHGPDGKGQPEVGRRLRHAAARFHRLRVHDAGSRSRLVVGRAHGRHGSARSIAGCRRSSTRCRDDGDRQRSSTTSAASAPSRGWPRGDLNFPRVFFTEKAFPENEAVLTTTMASHPSGVVENAFLYEHRIGRRAQYEVNVPFAVQSGDDGAWSRGLGDVNVALKYALFDSLSRGFIVSAGGEVTLPDRQGNRGAGRRRHHLRRVRHVRQGAAERRLPSVPRRLRGAGRRRRGEQGSRTGAPRVGKTFMPSRGGAARGRRWSKCSARRSSSPAPIAGVGRRAAAAGQPQRPAARAARASACAIPVNERAESRQAG